jgi:hypothetical protein
MKNQKSALQIFNILDRIWARDAVPWNLEQHYFLFWFIFYHGDIQRVAEGLDVHRNTVQFQFDRFGISEKSDQILKLWADLAVKKKDAYESTFFRLYKMYNSKSKVTSSENKNLIRLWKAGFSFKTLNAHYMLWALRNEKSKEWLQKKLGYTSHHYMRVLVSILDPNSTTGLWLAPLKPNPSEIYARGPKNSRLSKVG